MKFLADTHAFLWFVFGDSRISKRAEKLFDNPVSEVIFSVVSLWEIAIKVSNGKLRLGREFDQFVDEFILGRRLELMGLEIAHLKQNTKLPWHHRDPFDRLLAAQALCERLPVLTDDPAFKPYRIKTLW